MPKFKFYTLASIIISSLLLPVPAILAEEPVSSNNFVPTETYINGQQQVSVPDWSNITFSSLPPTEEAGKIDIPPELSEALGYNLNRSWQAGTAVDRILMLGDVQEAFGLNAFNLKDTSNLTGLAIQNLNLNDIGLLRWQTPKSLLRAIPQLGNLPIDRVAPLKDLWRQSGYLGSGTVAQLVRQNPLFGNLSLGKLDLRRYSLRSIPGLSQTPFGRFKDWQQSLIFQIPGLSSIPFNQFPVPLALNGISVARTDIVWSDAESGDPSVPPQLYVSGTVNRKGKTVPVGCQVGKLCAYIELSDLLGSNGSYHGKRWVSGRSQKVKGGYGPLKIINGGWEPTGIAVYPEVPFKVVLTDVNESKGTANFALYFHACRSIPFIGKSCTPYFIGPVPWLTTKEKGFVIVAATSKPNVNISSKYRERMTQMQRSQQEEVIETDSPTAPISDSDTRSTGKLTNPAPGAPVTSEFGPRRSPCAGCSSNHKGIDIGIPNGTKVKAADGGTVVYAGSASGYGNVIVIDHGNGLQTRYAHLEGFAAKTGTKVAPGQTIATSDSTGVGTGAHLHFEVRENASTNKNPFDPSIRAVNPRKYIKF